MGKKILLNIRSEPTYFTLIGISCHLKDYRLSYLLNQKLEYSFSKLEDLQDFSFYYYRDEDRYNTYTLIANRSQESVLVPQLKQTDFLLLVEGEFKKAQKDPVLNAIRTIPNVLTAYEIRLPEIKNFEILLTDIEMHVMNIFKIEKSKYQPQLKI
jgi:hypothetical protein